MQDQLEGVLHKAIINHVFPGAVLGYTTNGQRNILAAGSQTYEQSSKTVDSETIYDIASLTKVIPTNSLVLKLVERGSLSLDDQVIKFIPELKNPGRETILVKHLLTYSVIFALPHRLSEYASQGAKAIFEAIYNAPLGDQVGVTVLYTDAPVILAAQLVERVTKKPLDDLGDELLFKPLNMLHTTFHPDKFDKSLIAPSEIVDGRELKGVAHDEKARALLEDGIMPGHAGIFSDISDLLNFAEMLLNRGRFAEKQVFNPQTILEMHTNQIKNSDYAAGLGWHIKKPDFMGSKVSDQAFGKTGFTGPAILIDPDKKIAMVLLTNSTYPHRSADRDGINQVRRELADIIFS
ncbi:MAG TPA: serine hydrolase domain-containing protein [Candidatus Saccharimonadales bacterium]|nr:serine hydrolase domain-containing protein [Candidatus Saccharimonadales bacterium]